MPSLAPLLAALAPIGLVLAAMAAVGVVETLIPLRGRGPWFRRHLGPNLALTFITFATNLALNIALIAALVWAQGAGMGLLNRIAVPSWAGIAVAVLGLDFAFYVTHRAMHAVPAFWRFHSVHHADPFVDVTTTIRQHPGEGLIRYTFLAAFGVALGLSPAGFAVYRLWSALAGLVEHADIRLPRWLDGLLVLFVSTPDMHKIHHSRDPALTDRNFSNVTSLWDRLFFTYTPSSQGTGIAYGLEGHDDPRAQTTAGLLALPFRRRSSSEAASALSAEPPRLG